ncbi:hypothetical protein ACQJBY_001606 [Aegilops geniculata]
MATPEVVASDGANLQPDEPSRAVEAAPVAEPEEASDLGAVAAVPAVEEVAAGDAPPAPTPTSTSTSSAAVPPPPASPASAAAPGPPRPQFAGSPAYMAPPAPAFSYNVLPRAPPPQHMGSGLAHQQLASAPAPMARPMPPAALQPPAPRQYFGNRPSFSYNVVSHANASLPTGQQFQLDTRTNHAVQVPMFAPPASLQPPAPGQLPRLGAPFPGPMAPNPPASIRLPFPVPPRTPNILYDANPQQGNLDVGASKSDAPSAPEVSPHTVQSLPPRPEGFGAVGGSAPGQRPSNLSTPPSLLQRPTGPAPSLPQTSPSGAAPGAVPRATQQQFYPSYPSAPGNPPQPLWGYPPQPTGFQQAPFHSYPPGSLGPLGAPMVGTSSVTTSLPNIQPPGITTGDPKEQPSVNPGTVQSIHISVEQHPTGLEDRSTAGVQDSDTWSAHKTEAGVLYYYNALTGESTYQRPPGYKGELEKVAAQPVPASWDKIAGTDWSIVTTSDGKKYYYDNKQKVSSWQLPPEVAELNKNADSGNLKGSSTSLQDAGTVANKGEASGEISTPAMQTGGRDSLPLRQTVAPASPSALDLIKKKLQDAGAFSVSSPLATPSSSASELNGSKPADGAPKEQQGSKNGEKSKDNNGNENMSDSSSDSDDEEHGPSKEDCIREFKKMLKERGVAPFSKWEKELPKIVFDSRFKAIPSHSTRRAIFDHFVRTRADEERKEKRAAQKAAVEAYKQLLEEASEGIDSKTGYQDFERKWGADPRFAALDKKEREALFKEKVRALEEKVQSARNAVITDFKSMLRECKDIVITSRWTKVKENFRSDPRYKAVKHEERENAFNEYIAELKSAEREVEQAAKAKVDEQAKLRERERETRKRKEREEQEMERVKLKIRRKDATSSYQALLVETIKDPKASWTESKPKLEKDPQGRAVNPDLGQGEAEKLFREHVKDLYERCVRDFKALLSEAIAPDAATRTTEGGKTVVISWSEAKDLLRSDPRYSKVASKDRESMWWRYADDMVRKLKQPDTEKPDTNARQQQQQQRRSSDPPRRR